MTPETSIYEYARQGLALSADKTAIWFYGKSITYRELFRLIDNIADNLFAVGVRQGTVVTIHLPNCPQAVMAIYAVAKLGGICNMMHPMIPLKSLRENMDFTESQVLITGSHFADAEKAEFTELLIYADLSSHMATVSGFGFRMKNKNRRPERAIAFETLEQKNHVAANIPEQKMLSGECAWYLHSSGTTGTPKTVMHSHRAINQEAINIREGCCLGAVNEDVLLNVMPMYHGIGLVDDMHSAISGGTKIVQMASWDVNRAVRLIKKHRVTIMTVVPKIYYDLLKDEHFNAESYRICFSGGEVFDSKIKKEFYERTGKMIVEGYGMTELVAPCGVEVHDGRNSGFTPFPETRFAVINGDGIPKHQGEGELIVSSNTAMLGYLKDPAATEAAFLNWDDSRWLKTGDYGVVDDGGNFHFKERTKDIIIYNGNNVFPCDVEAAIMKSKAARDVCVVGIWDEDMHTETVCAYVVPFSFADETESRKQIEAFCAETLPAYAVPKRIRFLESMPRGATGKIDRKALKKHYE